jgi:beta-N-acetylhexosaminidase
MAYLDTVKDELGKAGFEVHLFKRASQREAAGEKDVNFMPILSEEATGDDGDRYDAAFVFASVKGFAQEAAIRIKWFTPWRRRFSVCHPGPHRVRFAQPAQPPD